MKTGFLLISDAFEEPHHVVIEYDTLDKEAQTICWNNGIDLCPDVLYEMGQNKAVQKEHTTEQS